MNLRNFLILFSFVILVPSISLSQVRKKVTTKQSAAKKEVLASNNLPADIEPRVFDHQENIKTSYDEIENQTSVSLDMPLSESRETGSNASPLSLIISFDYWGQKLKSHPQGIAFIIRKNVWLSTQSLFPKQPDIMNFIFLLDASPFIQRGISIRKYQTTLSGDGYLRDDFFATLSYRDFLRIANSNRVEFKIGYLKQELNHNQLEALRDFASRANLKSF